jgi:hypothetical protein
LHASNVDHRRTDEESGGERATTKDVGDDTDGEREIRAQCGQLLAA